jgi:hypothetical protein
MVNRDARTREEIMGSDGVIVVREVGRGSFARGGTSFTLADVASKALGWSARGDRRGTTREAGLTRGRGDGGPYGARGGTVEGLKSLEGEVTKAMMVQKENLLRWG